MVTSNTTRKSIATDTNIAWMNDNPRSSRVKYAYISVANHNSSSQSTTFLHKRSGTFFYPLDVNQENAVSPKWRLVLKFRHGAILRRVLNTDNRNNSKVHAIFNQIKSIVSEIKHADRRAHYGFYMPTDWRAVKACPLVTVTVKDVQKHRNVFIFMVEQSQNNPEDKNIRQHYCGNLKSSNIGLCVCVCVCVYVCECVCMCIYIYNLA